VGYKYAVETPGGWDVSPILTFTPGINYGSSLLLDDSGNPHVALETDAGIVHAWHDGALWNSEPAGGANPYIYSRSLVLKTDGSLHIAFYDGSDNKLYYTQKASGGSWSTPELVLDEELLGTNLSMDTGPGEVLRLVCYGTGLNFIWRTGDAWNRVKFDQGWVGIRNSMVVDNDGLAHISYQQRDDEDLKYATQLLPLD